MRSRFSGLRAAPFPSIPAIFPLSSQMCAQFLNMRLITAGGCIVSLFARRCGPVSTSPPSSRLRRTVTRSVATTPTRSAPTSSWAAMRRSTTLNGMFRRLTALAGYIQLTFRSQLRPPYLRLHPRQDDRVNLAMWADSFVVVESLLLSTGTGVGWVLSR